MKDDSEKLVLVIEFDRHDFFESIWLEPKEDAIKRFMAHNLCNYLHSSSSKEEKEVYNKTLDLCQTNKWNEAYEYWKNELEIYPRRDIHRPMMIYDLNEVPDLDEDLKWLQNAKPEPFKPKD